MGSVPPTVGGTLCPELRVLRRVYRLSAIERSTRRRHRADDKCEVETGKAAGWYLGQEGGGTGASN